MNNVAVLNQATPHFSSVASSVHWSTPRHHWRACSYSRVEFVVSLSRWILSAPGQWHTPNQFRLEHIPVEKGDSRCVVSTKRMKHRILKC